MREEEVNVVISQITTSLSPGELVDLHNLALYDSTQGSFSSPEISYHSQSRVAANIRSALTGSTVSADKATCLEADAAMDEVVALYTVSEKDTTVTSSQVQRLREKLKDRLPQCASNRLDGTAPILFANRDGVGCCFRFRVDEDQE